MNDSNYLELARHYEECFATHGPGHLGVDWPSESDAAVRYEVMLEVIRSGVDCPKLLDFGCGSAGLLSHIRAAGQEAEMRYRGHDISQAYIDYCRSVFPDYLFDVGDVLAGADIGTADYVVANGVFTERLGLSYDEMFDFMSRVVRHLFNAATVGIAFNVMSTFVDWQRDDLFHVDPGAMAEFVGAEFGANFTIRHDYPLFEYTTYVYK